MALHTLTIKTALKLFPSKTAYLVLDDDTCLSYNY